jgi:hypothetical protein
MRKIRLFYLLLGSAAVLGLSSCSKTDTPPGGSPIVVTLNPTTATIGAGDSVTINCAITDQNNLKDVVISEVIGSGSSSQLESYSLSGKTDQFNYTYHVPSVTVGSQIVLTFTIDDASNTQTATTTITVGAASSDINSYSAVLRGSYADPSAGSFYSSSTNTVYTVSTANQNQSAVDMVFFYGSTNQYTLAAPSDGSFGTSSNQISSLGIQNWTTKNVTNFKFTSLTDFSSITKAADIANAYNNASGSSDTKANMLAQGDIFAFQTAGNKYGLCKVVDETGGNTSGQGEMHIQVVVQK